MGRKVTYTIKLVRFDDDDYVAESATDSEGKAQVAAELQEAIDETGLPVGTFVVTKREVENVF